MKRKYNFAVMAVMLVIAYVLFVLIISGINKVIHLKLDLSQNRIFSLSDTTKEFLKTVEDEIDIYYLSEQNRESTHIKEVLARYESSGKNIHIQTVDMIKNPMFLNAYITEGETVDKGSIIVQSDKRFTFVNPEASIKLYSTQSNSNVSYTTGFELEKQLTNAIDYVTSNKTISVGYVGGHNGADFTLVAEKLKKENINVYETAITGDINNCDVVVFFGIRQDITDSENVILQDYLSGGGAVCIISNPGNNCPRLYKTASDYGIEINADILSEGDPSKVIYNEKHCFEGIVSGHKAVENIEGKKALIAFASALSVNSDGNHIVSPLIESEKTVRSYKVENNIETEFIKADSFCVGAISEVADTKSMLAVLPTTQMFVSGNETINSAVSTIDYTNYELLIQTIRYMSDSETGYLSVLPKSMASRSISISAAQKSVLIIIFGIGLPFAVLLLGVVVCIRRRNL